MSAWVALVMMVAGIGVRFWAASKFFGLYASRYSKAPSWSWPWTGDADPEVERWRRYTVSGSALLLSGAVLLIFSSYR